MIQPNLPSIQDVTASNPKTWMRYNVMVDGEAMRTMHIHERTLLNHLVRCEGWNYEVAKDTLNRAFQNWPDWRDHRVIPLDLALAELATCAHYHKKFSAVPEADLYGGS